MSRSLCLLAACAVALVIGVPGHAQDSPSLGDLARQAQKDKANAPAKKVITNEDLPSGSGSSASGLGTGVGRIAQPPAPGKPSTEAPPTEQLAHLESLLNQLDYMDRATLARNVLQGSTADFPARSKWEEKLFEAKQAFVAQGRDLIKSALQIEATAKTLQDTKDPNDPRVKDLTNRLQQLVQDGVRIGGTFQGVVEEGKDLAGLSSSR
jgi:hypothetical protein